MKKEHRYKLIFALTFFAVIFATMAVLYFFVKNLLILSYDI